MADTFKTLTAEQFASLDHSKYTLVDLREPAELIVSGIEGAINIPFSQFATKLDTIPKTKPVIVYCRVGEFSEEVADILSDRGYDVSHVAGGFKAYRELTEEKQSAKTVEEPEGASVPSRADRQSFGLPEQSASRHKNSRRSNRGRLLLGYSDLVRKDGQQARRHFLYRRCHQGGYHTTECRSGSRGKRKAR